MKLNFRFSNFSSSKKKMDDKTIFNSYAIKKVSLIEKIKYDKKSYFSKIESKEIVNVYEIKKYEIETKELNCILAAPNTFEISVRENQFFNKYQIINGVCETLTKQASIDKDTNDKRLFYQYNFITDQAFVIYDQKGVMRTFLYDIDFLQKEEEKIRLMKCKEIKRTDNSYNMEPLKYALIITSPDNILTKEAFMKCLNFNDIEIHKDDSKLNELSY